jgi:hypothetical protein
LKALSLNEEASSAIRTTDLPNTKVFPTRPQRMFAVLPISPQKKKTFKATGTHTPGHSNVLTHEPIVQEISNTSRILVRKHFLKVDSLNIWKGNH